MQSSPPRLPETLPSAAGVKRPASASVLLPGFDPCSSSPGLPRPVKRIARESPIKDNPLLPAFDNEFENKLTYPTPVPTSDTHILSSSPPPNAFTRRRPGLQRTVSTLSQREPLGTVPTAELDPSGEVMLFGRSGKSSHFQLHSTNKNISRVHLRASYVPPEEPNQPARVEIVCMGWNGMKIHCQGKHWELGKDDSFTSESRDLDIMVDVADTRVVIHWPKLGRKADTPETSDDNLEVEDTPSRRAGRLIATRSPFGDRQVRLRSPVSPTGAATAVSRLLPSDPPAVQIYEDHESDQDDFHVDEMNPSQAPTHVLSQPLGLNNTFQTQDFSDADEENDPVIHSFGPMGANLLPKLASFHAGASPEQPRRALGILQENPASPRSPLRNSTKLEDSPDIKFKSKDVVRNEGDPPKRVPIVDVHSHPVINHVVNQLAFSRLNQLPLSMLMNSLPSEMKQHDGNSSKKLCYDELRSLIGMTKCIGEVRRIGKDAAGAALESEYYYIPDEDFDESRKDAVVGQLRKPGLRACRKSHKQYFWRKPK